MKLSRNWISSCSGDTSEMEFSTTVVPRTLTCAPWIQGTLLGGLHGQNCFLNKTYMPFAYFTALMFAQIEGKAWIYLPMKLVFQSVQVIVLSLTISQRNKQKRSVSLKNTLMYETSRQSRFDARYWMLGAGALGRPRGRVWGGRREEGSGWGT